MGGRGDWRGGGGDALACHLLSRGLSKQGAATALSVVFLLLVTGGFGVRGLRQIKFVEF